MQLARIGAWNSQIHAGTVDMSWRAISTRPCLPREVSSVGRIVFLQEGIQRPEKAVTALFLVLVSVPFFLSFPRMLERSGPIAGSREMKKPPAEAGGYVA